MPIQSEIKTLRNEIKLMSENINTLKDVGENKHENKGSEKPYSTYAEKVKAGLNSCQNCMKLELELQVALNELNSVNLINNMLQEEIKSLSQTLHKISSDNNTWTMAKTHRAKTTRSLKTTSKPFEPIKTNRFITQTGNRFAALSRYNEPVKRNGPIIPSNVVNPSKIVPKLNSRYDNDKQRKLSMATEQLEPSTSHMGQP
jgi:hypothetical protein